MTAKRHRVSISAIMCKLYEKSAAPNQQQTSSASLNSITISMSRNCHMTLMYLSGIKHLIRNIRFADFSSLLLIQLVVRQNVLGRGEQKSGCCNDVHRQTSVIIIFFFCFYFLVTFLH